MRNKANLPRDRVSGIRDQSTDTRPPAPDPWSTAADCAKRTQFGLPPRGHGGRDVQNKPNCPLAGRQSQRWDQSCKTNPICRRCRAGRGLRDEDRGGTVQTNPISRPDRVGRGPGDDSQGLSHKQSQFPAGPEGPRPGMPRPWSQSCETKPISGRTERVRAARLPVLPVGAIMRNKANCAEAAGGPSTWWETSYGELNMHEASAKQSQFAPGRQ